MDHTRDNANGRFTAGLALADIVPVFFFCVSAAALWMALRSPLFLAGAVICALAGSGKVIWKLLIAFRGKDIAVLSDQLCFLMPAGFLLMIIGLLRADRTLVREMLAAAFQIPVILFFAAAACALAGMMVCARKFDRRDVRGSRIEEALNIIAQGCIMLGIVFVIYVCIYYHAGDEAQRALESDSSVRVSRTEDGWLFDGPSGEDALIFYPGAKVEETAYAPLLHLLASEGPDVFLCTMPYRLAVLSPDKADDVMNRYDYRHWYIGGHSLGGAMAASYAAGHADRLDGVILLAAYPTKVLDKRLKEISIYGSQDRVVNRKKLAEGKKLTEGALYELIIQGGNHAQFGDYGEQEGDGKASVSAGEQQRETVEYIVDMMRVL